MILTISANNVKSYSCTIATVVAFIFKYYRNICCSCCWWKMYLWFVGGYCWRCMTRYMFGINAVSETKSIPNLRMIEVCKCVFNTYHEQMQNRTPLGSRLQTADCMIHKGKCKVIDYNSSCANSPLSCGWTNRPSAACHSLAWPAPLIPITSIWPLMGRPKVRPDTERKAFVSMCLNRTAKSRIHSPVLQTTSQLSPVSPTPSSP